MENVMEVLNKRVFSRKKIYLGFFLFLTFVLIAEKRFIGIPKKAIIFLSIITFLVIFLWEEKIEKNTLMISLIFGITFSFVSPVFDVWDEPAHFARVQYISEGNLKLTNDKEDHVISKDQKILEEKTKYLSKKRDALPNLFKLKLWDYKHERETEYNYQVPVTNAYGTIGYLPGVLGYNVGKVISNGNLGVMFYLGRIFNAVFYSLCVFFAVRMAGKWKYILAFFAVQPVVIYAAGSFNQDAFGYGIMLLTVALFFKMIQNDEEKIRNRDLLLFICLCIILAFTKLPYIVLAGLVFFIPPKRFKDKKAYSIMLVGIILVILVSLFWFISYSKIKGIDSTNENVDVAKQVDYIIHNFKDFLGALFASMYVTIAKFGQLSSFGWDRKGSVPLALINLICIGIVMGFPMKDVEKVNKWTKFGIIFITFLISVLIYLSMYLTWTDVGKNYVSGVQGRYFVGLIMLLPIVMNYSKYIGNIQENYFTKKTPQVLAFLLLVWAIASRIGVYY